MRFLRFLLIALLGLVVVLGLVGGALAVLGRSSWGDAGWYYPWNYDPDYRLRCGQQALRHGNLERADQVALMLEADGAKDHAALLRGEMYFLRAKPYADRGNVPTAAPLLQEAVNKLNQIRDKGPILLQAAALLGKCFLYQRRFGESERAFLYVLSKDPDHVDAHRGLAGIYYDQGALARAIKHHQRVAELVPSDGRPYCWMGYMFKDLEQYDDASRCFQEALTRDLPSGLSADLEPGYVRKELADCLVKQSSYQQALEVLEQLDPAPENAAAVAALRAECLLALGRADEARYLLDEALATSSDNADLLRLRAKLHLEAKEFQAAVGLLSKAIRLNPADYASHNLLVQAYKQLGNPAKVAEQERILAQLKKDLDEFTQLNKKVTTETYAWDASARRRLAELADKLGKPDLGEMWRRAASNCPVLLTPEPATGTPKR
jgi:tetratricopeptide (TPR) repeat protein